MAKKNNINRERKIGKQVVEKKPLIDPKVKSTIWTVITLIILLVFFIINNTRTEPDEGPYPPNSTPIKVNPGN
ncbi:MAG: hypothetical protein Q8M94_05630 [Ignavibacteria bacterium]|nr:hypothetical protein [Ignavibacteria bacterium]